MKLSSHTLLKIIFYSCIVIFSAIPLIFNARYLALKTPVTHLDGAFQTASGLYRLNANQIPGRDFYPYLGIGPLFAVFPIFFIAGKNLSASVFSSQLVIFVTSGIVFGIIWHLIWTPKRAISSFIAGSFFINVLIALKIFFPNIVIPQEINWALEPGNSLRPLRAFLPYLVALTGILISASRSYIKLSANQKYISFGIFIGLISVWSNDFALPTASLTILGVIILPKISRRRKASGVLYFIGSSIVSSILLFIITTRGHAINFLKYNFIDVAHDQWWYFAPYGNTTRIMSPLETWKLFSMENYFPSLVLITLFFIYIKNPKKNIATLLWIGIVLFSGGSLASIGGHLGGYFGGFFFWGICVSFIWIIRLSKEKVQLLLSPRFITKLSISSSIFLALNYGFFTISAISNFYDKQYDLANNRSFFYIEELGGYLPIEWSDYVNFAKKDDSSAYEEYWGIWSAIRKSTPPYPVDAVIHALGNTRDIVQKKIANNEPGYYITTKASFSPDWQPWNLSQNYWFYKPILEKYSPIAYSPATIVWKRNDKLNMMKNKIDCVVNKDRTSFSLISPERGFYELTIEYSVNSSGRILLLVENNISFASDSFGKVSLDPILTRSTFPVYVTQSKTSSFSSIIQPKNKAQQVNFTMKDCKATAISQKDRDVLPQPGTIFYVTDDNWINGIARSYAGFYVPNTKKNVTDYVPGRYVRFLNGEERIIRTVSQNDTMYLNISVSGDTLNSDTTGSPNDFETFNKDTRSP